MPKTKKEKIEGLEHHRRLMHEKQMRKKERKQAPVAGIPRGAKK